MKFLKKIIFGVLILTIGFSAFFIFYHHERQGKTVQLSFQVQSGMSDQYQVFYAADGQQWAEERSISVLYSKVGEWEELVFDLPQKTQLVRVDVGTKPASIKFVDFQVSGNVKVKIPLNQLEVTLNQMQLSFTKENSYELFTEGEDPFFLVNIGPYILDSFNTVSTKDLIGDIIIVLFICFISSIILKYLKITVKLSRILFTGRQLILSLARNDFKTKYASSYLGVTWGFIQPILTVITYWFVFQIGLRSGNVSEVPFILWFIAGIVPWFFFADAFSGATNALSEYGYLVKKVVFQIELLPVVKIVSVLFVQIFFLGFILIVYSLYGYYPSLYNFQVLYYLFCMFILVVSLSYFTSAVVLFFKDLNQIIAIILQIGFWFTPIGWPLSILSDKWRFLFQGNPMYYIVQGYRDSFIDHILFYQRPIETLYFWFACLTILTAGVVIFRKLKPHFADVL
ncbi:ABC transporter permease [Paenibacillus mesotrionivorans]|uniref:ABC transporter permease n=1 Tax=Paenibacillus mesotrionivorans TaxID=3160968 RepID=A0ACC7NW29_9BACL